MTATVERFNNSSAVTFLNDDTFSKKRGITFGIQSAQSIPGQMTSQRQNKKGKQLCLPINFFHTPGEYNKMLIQLSSNQKINNFDRQIGILKSLEYINEPIFEKEKEKRNQRLKEYEQKRKEQRSEKTSSHISQCNCCCCDDYCQDCAANTLCEGQQSVAGHIKSEQTHKKWLIDIEGMKRGEYKQKKSQQQMPNNQEVQICHSRKIPSRYRIEELISNTLIQTIEQKRDKQLQELIKKEQKAAIKNYNQSVRAKNRCSSADKLKSKIQIKPTKSQIRQAYWESIKDLIAYQLKKPQQKSKLKPKNEPQCHKRSPHKFQNSKAYKLQGQRGKSAERELLKAKIEKAEIVKKKMEKLLVLDSKQKDIIKKCRSKKFKPNEKMIEIAFTHFI